MKISQKSRSQRVQLSESPVKRMMGGTVHRYIHLIFLVFVLVLSIAVALELGIRISRCKSVFANLAIDASWAMIKAMT